MPQEPQFSLWTSLTGLFYNSQVEGKVSSLFISKWRIVAVAGSTEVCRCLSILCLALLAILILKALLWSLKE